MPMLTESETGAEHPIEKRTTVLGRDESCDITCPSRLVSREHARIHKRVLGGYTIEDLGSTHGSYVNDERVHGTQRLQDGDVVTLAKAPVREKKKYGISSDDPRETSKGWGLAPEPAPGEIRRGDVRLGAEFVFSEQPRRAAAAESP